VGPGDQKPPTPGHLPTSQPQTELLQLGFGPKPPHPLAPSNGHKPPYPPHQTQLANPLHRPRSRFQRRAQLSPGGSVSAFFPRTRLCHRTAAQITTTTHHTPHFHQSPPINSCSRFQRRALERAWAAWYRGFGTKPPHPLMPSSGRPNHHNHHTSNSPPIPSVVPRSNFQRRARKRVPAVQFRPPSPSPACAIERPPESPPPPPPQPSLLHYSLQPFPMGF
jgi:hypothetical protein